MIGNMRYVGYTKNIQYTELLWLVVWDKLATRRLCNTQRYYD